MSSLYKRSSASITRTDGPHQELRVPAAPSSFKHTIDLPPSDSDDYYQANSTRDVEAGDEVIAIQKEEMRTSSKKLPENNTATGEFGLNGLGLIPETHTFHKRKDDEGRKDKHRKQGHRLEVAAGSSRSVSSAKYSKAHDFVEGRSRRSTVRREDDLNNLKGFGNLLVDQPGELDELDIALVRPEEQWRFDPTANDSMDTPLKLDSRGKGKGKFKEVGW